MFNFNFFRSEVGKVSQAVNDLRTTLDRARRRREELQTAPLAKSDAIAILHSWIDAEAAKYPAALRKAMDQVIRNPGTQIGAPNCPNLPLLTALDHVGLVGSPEHVVRNLFFFMPDAFKAGVEKAVRAMEIEGEGPPLAERAREIADLDRQIPRLEAELDQVVSEAASAGISLDGVTVKDPRRKA